jgi:glycosyltransferase involved in cell wall biosynthesis
MMVTARYLPHTGGVEHHVYQVGRRLARNGVEVTILTTDLSGELPMTEVVEGMRIRRVHAWPKNRDYYVAPSAYQIVKRGDWDIVHCQGYQTLFGPLAMLAAWRSGTPYVVTFHGGGHSSRLRRAIWPVRKAALRPLLARADRLIANASFEIELFSRALRLPTDRFALIPSGSDLPRPAVASQPNTDGTLILSVGRLERYKGHHRVIEAFPKVLDRVPNAHLRIVGAGPFEQHLRRLVSSLDIANRVEIRGVSVSDRGEIATVLSQASLVTLLSDYETYPVAALEAISLGKPVLLSDSSGMRELAERGLAKSIPLTSTTDEVATAVVEQLCHPLLPSSINLPTWDDCAAELLSLYQAVVRSHRHAS